MKNLTVRYAATQFTHWASISGATAFATAYFLEKGVSAGMIGLLLALAGLCSCLTQPLLAAGIDRAEPSLLRKALCLLSLISTGCLLLQLIPGMPLAAAAAAYTAGIWSSDAMAPLLNALSVACNAGGYPINYGAGRATGSISTALSNLVIGYILARLGSAWMIVFLLLTRIGCLICLAGYPNLSAPLPQGEKKPEGCSVFAFFGRYPIYCLSLLGIGLLGMYHAMTENYMIAIVGALGGDSSHVGTALFISAMSSVPVIFFFSRIRPHFRDATLLKIAAASFLIKAVCFYFAGSVSAIYCFQLLQITSWAVLAPTEVYYASARVDSADMVKGQAFITAAYALGCSAGNFTGGQLLPWGAKAILLAGIAIALAGALVIFATVDRKEAAS